MKLLVLFFVFCSASAHAIDTRLSEAEYQKLFSWGMDLAQSLTGRKFHQIPTLHVMTLQHARSEISRKVEREFARRGLPTDRASCSSVRFAMAYCALDHSIYVATDSLGRMMRTLVAKGAKPSARGIAIALFVHEGVHALQEEQTGVLSLKAEADNDALIEIIHDATECQAEHFERMAARKLGSTGYSEARRDRPDTIALEPQDATESLWQLLGELTVLYRQKCPTLILRGKAI